MKSIVLITGASGGIGKALAYQLHNQGLRVAVVGRDRSLRWTAVLPPLDPWCAEGLTAAP